MVALRDPIQRVKGAPATSADRNAGGIVLRTFHRLAASFARSRTEAPLSSPRGIITEPCRDTLRATA
jgi:hypothetical protein